MRKYSAPARAQGVKALAFFAILTSGFLYAAEWSHRTISTGEVHRGGLWLGGNESITQTGGSHFIAGSLQIAGGWGRKQAGPYSAYYALHDGYLSANSLWIHIGGYSQNGGTNEVSRTFHMSGSWLGNPGCTVSGGLLVTSNLVVGPGTRWITFQHTGGRVVVTNLELHADLQILASSTRYSFSGGELIVENIFVNHKTRFGQLGGRLHHTGLLTLAGGTFAPDAGTQSLGRVALKHITYASNSLVVLPFYSCVLRFQPSGSEVWEAGAALLLCNWAGLPEGNGEHQVIFGQDADGISAQQLAQIRFIDPRGYPAGEYGAAMLDSGEIVARVDPTTRPTISYNYYGYDSPELQLTWRPGYILQAATSPAGPFEDVATSSSLILQVDADEAARFFRLRR